MSGEGLRSQRGAIHALQARVGNLEAAGGGGSVGIGDYASGFGSVTSIAPGTTGTVPTFDSYYNGDNGGCVSLPLPTTTLTLAAQGCFYIGCAIEVSSVTGGGGTVASVTAAWFQPNYISGAGFDLVGCPRGWFGIPNDGSGTGHYLQANALINTFGPTLDLTWNFGVRGSFTHADFTCNLEVVRVG